MIGLTILLTKTMVSLISVRWTNLVDVAAFNFGLHLRAVGTRHIYLNRMCDSAKEWEWRICGGEGVENLLQWMVMI